MPGIGGQHPFQPPRGFGRAIGHDDLPGVLAVSHPHAAAVMEGDPRCAAYGVDEQRVQDGPIGDGIRTIAHGFGFAVGGGHRAAIEMVAPNHDGRFDRPACHHLVELQAGAGAFAIAQPANARWQPLERHFSRAIVSQRRKCSSSGKSSRMAWSVA